MLLRVISCQSAVPCVTELSPDVRFCSFCGQPASGNGNDLATIDYPPTATSPLPPRPPSSSSRSSSRPSSDAQYQFSEGRFLPGRLLASRYRIIALLGRGGMGEVYRADDLTLGQAVALKFLPDAATHDDALLERFRTEVRIARRVSHPNVCRVYDVGEVDGQTFFTMEYIDGEDLASLLRRIGRLPQDKAVEIARQLCAGLAAAHAKGVFHRDRKPANIPCPKRQPCEFCKAENSATTCAAPTSKELTTTHSSPKMNIDAMIQPLITKHLTGLGGSFYGKDHRN
jgi:hypothetical protein